MLPVWPPALSPRRVPARDPAPLRARSVCLAERPRSRAARVPRSAPHAPPRYSQTHFYHQTRNDQDQQIKPKRKPSVFVKPQNRTVVRKEPLSISVQTLQLPTKYDHPKARLSLRPALRNEGDDRTKTSNPLAQVGSGSGGLARLGGTENRLLLQIAEAEQVADFERILNSNAISCERARRSLWCGVAAAPPSASLVPRPRSAYSLHAVSEAYCRLFRQHEDSLQPLIDSYRRDVSAAADRGAPPAGSLLAGDWYEELHDLSQFYEDDADLKEEIESITDACVAEQLAEDPPPRNFNVNLTGLLGLRCSPATRRRSPDFDPSDADDDKEWHPSMSADDRPTPPDDNCDELARDLEAVKLEDGAAVPTITFSACSESRGRSELPGVADAVRLAVPAVESGVEARPPMM